MAKKMSDVSALTAHQPVDPVSAADVKSYALQCWTYKYHSGYGDPPQDTKPLMVKSATVGEDGKSVTLVIEGLETFYVHELKANGIRNRNGQPLLHPEAYYTLTRIPKS